MGKMQISTKRIAIDKANTQVVIAAGIAAFITVFSLVASQALMAQTNYLNKVIGKKEAAHKQLKSNIAAADQLVASYQKFTAEPVNAIGGKSNGNGENDGDNATLVLDALPSSYDFPALTSSLEKILTGRGLKIASISGTDEQATQGLSQSSANPQPVPMSFNFSVSDASYTSIQDLIAKLQTSIRPLSIDTLSVTGGANNMQLVVTGHTYYQPGKSLSIKKVTL